MQTATGNKFNFTIMFHLLISLRNLGYVPIDVSLRFDQCIYIYF